MLFRSIFLREHLIFKVLRSDLRPIAALPSSAHTYRLLIFKELPLRSPRTFYFRAACRQIVLFVSSREMRLCSTFRFPSTALFSCFLKTSHPTTTLTIPPIAHSTHPFLQIRLVSQREPNYSKHSSPLASTFLKSFNLYGLNDLDYFCASLIASVGQRFRDDFEHIA